MNLCAWCYLCLPCLHTKAQKKIILTGSLPNTCGVTKSSQVQKMYLGSYLRGLPKWSGHSRPAIELGSQLISIFALLTSHTCLSHCFLPGVQPSQTPWSRCLYLFPIKIASRGDSGLFFPEPERMWTWGIPTLLMIPVNTQLEPHYILK